MEIPRIILFLFGLFLLLLGVTLCWGAFEPWMTSYAFGSLFVAASIAIMWIAILQAYKCLVGAGLSGAVGFGACAVVLLKHGMFWGEISLLLAIGSLWYFFLGHKIRAKEVDYLPVGVQCLFGLTMTVFLLEGVYLAVPMETHFAWVISAPYAQAFGWLLIGSCLFLGWALMHPTWENGYPQLYSILALDLMMIGPLFSLIGANSVEAVTITGFLLGALFFVIVTGVWTVIALCKRFFGGASLPKRPDQSDA